MRENVGLFDLSHMGEFEVTGENALQFLQKMTTNDVAALEDYKMTSAKVVEDILAMFPVPTQKDMDELYKEIYLLKKKVKALEKEKARSLTS